MSHNPEKIIYKNNIQAILRIMGLLLCLLITLDLYIIKQQFDNFFESTEIHLNEELELAGSFSLEPLLKNDYVLIEEFFKKWVQDHDAILKLEVLAPNGFKLVDFKRDTKYSRSISARYPIIYNDETLLTIDIIEDVSPTYNLIISSTINLIGFSIILVVAFSYLLWITLRKTAIKPLEKEIVDRQKTEKRLSQKTKELEFSNSELEAYSYSIAHDLRTPLRAIVSFSQLLKDDAESKLNDAEKDSLNRVIASGKKMSNLINDILNLAKISRIKLNKTELNLSAIVKEQFDALKTLHCSNAKLTKEDDLYCKGDSTLINTLVTNLLSNACKYSINNPNPEIQFGAQQDNNSVIFYIRDQGIGINMKYSNKLFKPFERLHTDKNIEGTGIGLAICKRIIDRHGGKIWIESSENIGTTVFFTFPN